MSGDLSPSARLALGTVQMGLPYGVMNGREPIDRGAIPEILRLAWASGIDMLDTEAGYGDAEQRIGEAKPKNALFDVISKTPGLEPLNADETKLRAVSDGVQRSLDQLRIDCLAGLLVHQAGDLLGSIGHRLFDELSRLKARNVVRKIGVSVYDPDTLTAIVDRFPVEIVQLPLNVLDQRFARTGVIFELARKGIEIHVRSVFLQGALIADAAHLPAAIAKAGDSISHFQKNAKQQDLSPVEAALSFVNQCEGVRRIVVGVDSSAHLRDIVAAFEKARAVSFDGAGLSIDDLEIVDPRRWGVA